MKKYILVFFLCFLVLFGCTQNNQQQIQQQSQGQVKEQKNPTNEVDIESFDPSTLTKGQMLYCNAQTKTQNGDVEMNLYAHIDKENNIEKSLWDVSSKTMGITAFSLKAISIKQGNTLTSYTSKEILSAIILARGDKENQTLSEFLHNKFKDCDYFVSNTTLQAESIDAVKNIKDSVRSQKNQQNTTVKCYVRNVDNSLFEPKGKICDFKEVEALLNQSMSTG
jgi:hypothetical protein